MEKVSLILTTYNCKDNLIKTLESIEKQDYPNIQVIIKDGKSKDGTLDVIKEYQHKSHFEVIWESKCDTGIYDAMNQGYTLSSGEVVAFFNDVFVTSTAVSKLIGKMKEKSDKTGKDYIGVHADLVYANGEKIIRKWKTGNGKIRQGWMPGHPTLFLKRFIYEKYGLYDTNFKISADYEFMVRFLKDEDNELAYLPETVVSMFYGGTSTGGLRNYLLSFVEAYKSLKNNKVPYALVIVLKRTWFTLRQFVKEEKNV